MSKYDDIINLERPVSKRRNTMSIKDRAFQFAPFSALAGYNEAIKETERITDNKKVLSDGGKEIINDKLCYIKNNINDIGEVTITYYIEDKKKNGGKYVNVTERVKKVDTDNLLVYMMNGFVIPFDDISDINGSVFNYLEM